MPLRKLKEKGKGEERMEIRQWNVVRRLLYRRAPKRVGEWATSVQCSLSDHEYQTSL